MGTAAVLLFVWAIGLWLMFIITAVEIAQRKGRSTGSWALLAIAYGIFAVIAVYLLPPITPLAQHQKAAGSPDSV